MSENSVSKVSKTESTYDQTIAITPSSSYDLSAAERLTPKITYPTDIPANELLLYRIGFYTVLMLGLLILAFTLNGFYLSERMVWNTYIGPVNVGGKTISEARNMLEDYLNEFKQANIPLRTNKGVFIVSNAGFGTTYDIESALIKAYKKGHDEHFWPNQRKRLSSFFSSQTIQPQHWFDINRFTRLITNSIPALKYNQPTDATVSYVNKEFVVVPGTDGLGFDEEAAVKQYEQMLSAIQSADLNIEIKDRTADIDVEIAESARKLVNSMSRRHLVMMYSYDGYNYDRWSLSLRESRDWFEFKKIKEMGNANLYPVLKNDKLRAHLNKRIAPYMYLAKEDITIKNVNGKPVAEGVAKDGYYLDVRKSVNAINDSLMANRIDTVGNYAVMLEVAHLIGGVSNPDNEFNISDVLATGVTDFFGSPQNRKFNIGHAAKNFQNLVLHPGERFSFIKQMGIVDSTTGYLKELVIVNGDSTEPQYGGGICQVSSTLFRTVFFAGLDIVNRINHSFEVKYYRPVGLDATIFDPSPDLIFKNDTENLILIQNYVDIKRTKLYFKIFGKKDGRKASFEGPVYDGLVGEKQEHYRYTWFRHIEYKDGKQITEKYPSVYRNKDLVKKHNPSADSLAKVMADSLAKVFADSVSAARDDSLKSQIEKSNETPDDEELENSQTP
ncbi:VanW family protein [bacterium]|nr:VanW family protein [bacterium]